MDAPGTISTFAFIGFVVPIPKLPMEVYFTWALRGLRIVRKKERTEDDEGERAR